MRGIERLLIDLLRFGKLFLSVNCISCLLKCSGNLIFVRRLYRILISLERFGLVGQQDRDRIREWFQCHRDFLLCTCRYGDCLGGGLVSRLAHFQNIIALLYINRRRLAGRNPRAIQFNGCIVWISAHWKRPERLLFDSLKHLDDLRRNKIFIEFVVWIHINQLKIRLVCLVHLIGVEKGLSQMIESLCQ